MTARCDYCGDKKNVVVTKYGTTNYRRLICRECIRRINTYHRTVDGVEVLNEDGTFKEEV